MAKEKADKYFSGDRHGDEEDNAKQARCRCPVCKGTITLQLMSKSKNDMENKEDTSLENYYTNYDNRTTSCIDNAPAQQQENRCFGTKKSHRTKRRKNQDSRTAPKTSTTERKNDVITGRASDGSTRISPAAAAEKTMSTSGITSTRATRATTPARQPPTLPERSVTRSTENHHATENVDTSYLTEGDIRSLLGGMVKEPTPPNEHEAAETTTHISTWTARRMTPGEMCDDMVNYGVHTRVILSSQPKPEQ
jgi:hypothetical protein